MKVCQFLPYFPPHKGGLETVAEEFSKYFVSEGCGEVLNVVFSVGQESLAAYKKDGYQVLILPAFDLIPNYPFPKFWTKQFWSVLQQAKRWDPDIIQTHTRFFLATFLGGICAKLWKKKRVHIEHGSDYVQVSSWWKNKIAYWYDRLVGKWVFKKSNFIVPISNACKHFIEKEFTKRAEIQVIYRWLDIPEKLPEVEDLHKKFPWKILVWFIGRLYKWKNVENLIKAYYALDEASQRKIQLVIVGDWEDYNYLKSLDSENRIYFTGGKPFLEALSYQRQFDVHYHTSNPGWGLATTLLQAMYFWSLIVATPNEWALDVLENKKNAIVLKNSSLGEIKSGLEIIFLAWNTREKWASINKEIINEKFQWEKNIQEYLALYSGL